MNLDRGRPRPPRCCSSSVGRFEQGEQRADGFWLYLEALQQWSVGLGRTANLPVQVCWGDDSTSCLMAFVSLPTHPCFPW